jgi:hypothetical protein
MQRSFFYCTALVLALASFCIGTTAASAQEKAGTRAMREEGKTRREQRTQPLSSQELSVTCEPEEVVVASVIRFMLPKLSKVSVSVYDESGREVALLDNQKRHPGLHQVIFDRRDLPDGVYYCKVVAGGSEVTQRMVLVSNPQ